MERRIVNIPRSLFRMSNADWDIDWRAQSTGDSTAGYRNIDIGFLPRWVGSPSVSHVRKEIGGIRALRAYGRGIMGLYRLRMTDPIFPTGSPLYVPFSDRATFSDGGMFDEHPTATLVSAAAVGDNEVVIDFGDYAEHVGAGKILSHNDLPFMISYMRLNSGTEYTCGVEMPIREVIAAGSAIELDATGIFEFAEVRTGSPAYGSSQVSKTTFQFQEYMR